MQQVAGVESKNVCVLTIDEIAIQMNQGFIFARIPEWKINGPKNGPSLRNFGMKRDDVLVALQDTQWGPWMQVTN
jgi:hypothetical protein